jgi:DNA-binding MurR/RpiR family transcriptional regulator
MIKIRQGMETFSPAERKIGTFILQNTNEFLGMSITQAAQKSGASEASIVRFCKGLGLKGYQELKICISADIAKPEVS